MTATCIARKDIFWPAPVAIAPERVLEGSPMASTLVVDTGECHQMGLWRVSEGSFTTDHTGYTEYIHILEGRGQLIDEAGTVTHLEPGSTVFMEAGWRGRWVIDHTISKVFATVRA